MGRCDMQWRRYWVVSLSEHLFFIFSKVQSLPSPRNTARPEYQLENTFSLEHDLGEQVLWSLLDQVIQCTVIIAVHNIYVFSVKVSYYTSLVRYVFFLKKIYLD